jgi:hypothetical protein
VTSAGPRQHSRRRLRRRSRYQARRRRELGAIATATAHRRRHRRARAHGVARGRRTRWRRRDRLRDLRVRVFTASPGGEDTGWGTPHRADPRTRTESSEARDRARRVRDAIEAVDRISEPLPPCNRSPDPGRSARPLAEHRRCDGQPSLPVGIRAVVLAQPAGRRLLDATFPPPVIVEVAYGPQADGWLGAPASSPYKVQGVVRHQLDAQRIDELAALLCSTATLDAPSGHAQSRSP